MRRTLLVMLAVVLMAFSLGVPASAGESDVVTVVGPFVTGDSETDAFVAELSAFAAKKSFEVVYEGYSGYADLVDRIEGDDPPDAVVVPQPGVLLELADHIVDLTELVNEKKLDEAFGEYLNDLVTAPDGAVLGAPIKLDLKSLVWYEPNRFAAYGYEVPETFDELVVLTDSVVAEGETPWCNYIESGSVTGWLATDWVEDLLLGAEGPDVYDWWIDHTVPFTDPRVEDAFVRYDHMIETPGYVFDRLNMLTYSFVWNAFPLGFGDCWMHRQASYFGFFLQYSGFDLDDFATFKFPSVGEEYGDAAVGGGVYMAVLDDRRDVKKLAKFVVSEEFGETAMAESGGWVLPHTDFDHSLYDEGLIRSWADIVRAAVIADQFRFDASDMMPAEVGFGTFLTGMVDLISGAKDIPEVLADIDASWPS